jgi:hypothetical protein
MKIKAESYDSIVLEEVFNPISLMKLRVVSLFKMAHND